MRAQVSIRRLHGRTSAPVATGPVPSPSWTREQVDALSWNELRRVAAAAEIPTHRRTRAQISADLVG